MNLRLQRSYPDGLPWWAKTALCVLVAASLLLSLAMAASPALHKFFHEDADSAEHACAATLIASGQVLLVPEPDVFVALVRMVFFLAAAGLLLPHGQRDLQLPVGRAPPQV